MKPSIFIDGHNLIHRVKELREYMQTDHELARNELIGRLVRLISNKNINIHLVFDGNRVGQPSNQYINGIHVTYSIKPQTADTVIKLLLDKSNNPRNVLVVSSDNSVYQYAKTSKAQVLRSEEFYKKYIHVDRSFESTGKEKEMSPEELQNWIELFDKKTKNEES